MPKQNYLQIGLIRIDGETQSRVQIDIDYVEELRDAIRDVAVLPPVDVWFDGDEYWLSDGFHRHLGYLKADMESIPVTIHQGTVEDARWAACAANQTHGLRRTNKDKIRAVLMALKHPNADSMTDREIAKHCGVDHKTVAKYRPQKSDWAPGEPTPTGGTGQPGEFPTETNLDGDVDDPEEVAIPPDYEVGGIEAPGEFPTRRISTEADATPSGVEGLLTRKRGRPSAEDAARRAMGKRGSPAWNKAYKAYQTCLRSFDELKINDKACMAAFATIKQALENC